MEQDPMEILEMVRKCIDESIAKISAQSSLTGYSKIDIAAIGITNQRETIVVWDKTTGRPLYNAIGECFTNSFLDDHAHWRFFSFSVWNTAWNDLRTEETVEKILDQTPNRDPDYYKPISGLPISIYFSALKIMWLKDNVPHINDAFKQKTCFAGTIDSWLTWVSMRNSQKSKNQNKTFSFFILNKL